jgi:DNA-3-methyladenine glycosylase
MRALRADFYERPVLEVARGLIGCAVEHEGTAGVIVETEAYHDSEPASHAFVGLTPRTSTLFGPAGHAYVYRSYGIHALLNAVCECEGVGAGVLIRALQPLAGLEAMRARRGLRSERDLCSGPGKLTQALGVELSDNGCSLSRGPVVIRAPAAGWRNPQVVVGPRVGITRAVELPWRFCVVGNPNVSRPRPRSADGGSAWRSPRPAAGLAAAAAPTRSG